MNLLKDGVLVTLITSSLAGSPQKTETTHYISDLERKLSETKIENYSYSRINKSIIDSYKQFKLPEYITLASQLARSYIESSNNPYAESKAGAIGLFQIVKDSWNDVMEQPFDMAKDPYLNSIASLKHLKKLDTYLRQNYPDFEKLSNEKKFDIINAAYNGGQGRLKSVNWNIDEMPKETRDYVKKMKERTYIEEKKLRYY